MQIKPLDISIILKLGRLTGDRIHRLGLLKMDVRSATKSLMIFSALTFGLAGHALANVSGLYLSSDRYSVETIQIVQQDNGSLQGRLESFQVNERGSLETSSVAFTGSEHNGKVVINTNASLQTLFSSMSLTGRIRGNTLELVWENGSGSFRQSNIEGRGEELRRLGETAALLAFNSATAEAFEKFTTGVDTLMSLVERTDTIIASMDEAHSHYSNVMEVLETRRRQLAILEQRDSPWQVQSDLRLEIGNLEREAQLIAMNVSNLRRQLNDQMRSVQQNIDEAIAHCRLPRPVPTEIEYCAMTEDASHVVQELIDTLRPSFTAWDELLPES